MCKAKQSKNVCIEQLKSDGHWGFRFEFSRENPLVFLVAVQLI